MAFCIRFKAVLYILCSDAVDDGLACRHRIGTDTAVVCKERYGVIIVGAESIGHLGRVSSGALL